MNSFLKFTLIAAAGYGTWHLYKNGRLNKMITGIREFGIPIPFPASAKLHKKKAVPEAPENAIDLNAPDIRQFKENLGFLNLVDLWGDEGSEIILKEVGAILPDGKIDNYFIQNFNWAYSKITGNETPLPKVSKNITTVIKKGDKGDNVLKLISILNAVMQDNELTEGVYDTDNVYPAVHELFNGCTCYKPDSTGAIDLDFVIKFYNLLPEEYKLIN